MIFLGALSMALLLGMLSLSSPGYRLETFVLDHWFPLRYQLFGSEKIDPRLVMVGIDESTIQSFGKPTILWQKDFADLISTIQKDEPAVIGLDFVIAPEVQGLTSDDPLRLRIEEEALELGLTALEGPPVVFVEVYSEGFIYFAQADKDEVVSPHEVLLDLLLEDGDSDRLGLANLVGDLDGVLRRNKIFLRHQNVIDTSQPANLAFLLLEHATGIPVDYSSVGRKTKLTWNNIKVPFLLGDSFLLNYPGPIEDDSSGPEGSLTFPVVSATRIQQGEIEPGYFKDKIVLIAPTAVSLFDWKVVPGDNQYPGGGAHLTTLNMFLQNQFISRQPVLWVVLSLVLVILGVKLGRKALYSAGVVALILTPVLTFAAFVALRCWLPTIFPLLSLSLGLVLGYMERHLTVERDRALVRSTFARMVSPQVMHHVLANHRDLENAQRKEITVLFSDINNFTPACERHTPEEVIKMLSDYFSLMVDVIMKYDGYLKQYVGDEIMVIFGAPEDSKDHASRAVQTALEMRRVLAEAKAKANNKPGFYDIKMGINTGSVVVGKVGPESRWEYAAVGDDVNLGARVMSVAQKLGLDIGVSAATRDRFNLEAEHNPSLHDMVAWHSQGIQSFKGKISQMEIFSIDAGEACAQDDS